MSARISDQRIVSFSIPSSSRTAASGAMWVQFSRMMAKGEMPEARRAAANSKRDCEKKRE